jgi:hypothetical protein
MPSERQPLTAQRLPQRGIGAAAEGGQHAALLVVEVVGAGGQGEADRPPPLR